MTRQILCTLGILVVLAFYASAWSTSPQMDHTSSAAQAERVIDESWGYDALARELSAVKLSVETAIHGVLTIVRTVAKAVVVVVSAIVKLFIRTIVILAITMAKVVFGLFA